MTASVDPLGAAADPSPHATVPPTAGLPLRLSDLAPLGDDGFESALARWLGVDDAQLECSGTAALCVALTALKTLAPQRHAVVVPAYTCPLVALAVARCRLTLRVCDVAPGSFDFDAAELARLCDADTLAVVPTHIGGRVGNVDDAIACATAVGAFTIEDAAQALGARRGGTSIGTACDIGFFSLAVGKGLTLFEGGVLVARTAELRAACRAASGQIVPRGFGGWEMRRCLELAGYALAYRPSLLGWFYRRPLRHALARRDWEAAAGDDLGLTIPLHRVSAWRRRVGVRALARLPAFLTDGRARAERRWQRLGRIHGLTVLHDTAPDAPDAQGVWPVLLVMVPTAAQRNALLQRLWGSGAGLGVPFVRVLTDYRRYAHCLPAPADTGALPHARDLAGRLLSLSNSPWLDDARFEWLCGEIERTLLNS